MSELLVMPGVERRDLVGEPVPSEEVLRAAIEKDIRDVVIVGRRRDGGLYVAGESNDADRVAGILARAMNFVANGYYGGSRREHGGAGGER